jgi:transposase
MAAHYGVVIMPARAYKPRDKPKAENGVLIAERWIIARLRDRSFCSLGEANAAIRNCVAKINARHRPAAGDSPGRQVTGPGGHPLSSQPDPGAARAVRR